MTQTSLICDFCGKSSPAPEGIDRASTMVTLALPNPGRYRDQKDFCCIRCMMLWLEKVEAEKIQDAPGDEQNVFPKGRWT